MSSKQPNVSADDRDCSNCNGCAVLCQEHLLAVCRLETALRLLHKTSSMAVHMSCSSKEAARESCLKQLATCLTGAGC